MKIGIGIGVIGALLVAARPAEARGCTEKSDVVGYQTCTRFGGTWSTEGSFPVAVSLGVERLTLPLRATGVEVNWGPKANRSSLSLDGSKLVVPGLVAVGPSFRISVALFDFLYAGFGFGAAFGDTATAPFAVGAERFSAGSGLQVQMHWDLVAGVRVPLSWLSLRLEAVGSLRAASQPVVREATREDAQIDVVRGVIEPRLAVDIWTTPWLTVSTSFGVDALRPEAQSWGLSLALHGRAFDGRRTLAAPRR